jgi:hypothetical protein
VENEGDVAIHDSEPERRSAEHDARETVDEKTSDAAQEMASSLRDKALGSTNS